MVKAATASRATRSRRVVKATPSLRAAAAQRRSGAADAGARTDRDAGPTTGATAAEPSVRPSARKAGAAAGTAATAERTSRVAPGAEIATSRGVDQAGGANEADHHPVAVTEPPSKASGRRRSRSAGTGAVAAGADAASVASAPVTPSPTASPAKTMARGRAPDPTQVAEVRKRSARGRSAGGSAPPAVPPATKTARATRSIAGDDATDRSRVVAPLPKASPADGVPVGKVSAGRSLAAKPPTAAGGCAPINLGFLSGFIGFHLRLAQDASYRAFARFKEKDLVKPGRFPALAIIHLNPGISQSALGRAIARDKSTVSPLIKDLQKNGLINRKPSPNDRRSVTLVLTKKGERVLDRLHVRAREHENDLDKLVGSSKVKLVGLLDKITGALTA